MPFGLQPIHLVVIAIVALLIFGPQKLPEIGRGVGKALNEFRRGMRDMGEGFKDEVNQPADPAAAKPQAPAPTPLFYQSAVPQPSVVSPAPAQAGPKTGTTYCSTCGAPNPVGSKFCNACGSPLALPPAPEPGQVVIPAQEQSAAPVEVVDSVASAVPDIPAEPGKLDEPVETNLTGE